MSQSQAFYFNNQSYNIVPDPDAEADPGNFTQVKTVEELMSVPKESLMKIHASAFGRPSLPGDSKKSAKKLAVEIFAELERSDGAQVADGEEKPKRTRTPKEPKEKKPSKMDRIREIVQERGVIAKAELAELIGSDEQNTHTMISIMKNAKRTKDPVEIAYDKKQKLYAWPGVEFPEAPTDTGEETPAE